MRITYIYTLTDPRDGLIHYVGRTNNPQRRKWEHRAKLKTTYSPWHQELLATGLKPIFQVVEQVSGPGVVAEKMWMRKLKDAGHPIVNSQGYKQGKLGSKVFRGVVVKTAEEVKRWRAKDIQLKWKKWWDSLPTEEKSQRQRSRVNVKSKQAGRDFWKNMTPEQRAEFCRKRWERMSTENKAKVLAGNRK